MPTQSWDDLVAQVDRMRGLEEDWDGLGAVAPDHGIVDAAVRLLRAFQADGLTRPPDRAIPGVNGTVILEWYTPGGGYEEVEVESSMLANRYVVPSDSRFCRAEPVPIPPV